MLCRIRKEVGMAVGGEGQRQAVLFGSHAASRSTEGQKTYSQEAKEAWSGPKVLVVWSVACSSVQGE
jgi:hypothetical protein